MGKIIATENTESTEIFLKVFSVNSMVRDSEPIIYPLPRKENKTWQTNEMSMAKSKAKLV